MPRRAQFVTTGVVAAALLALAARPLVAVFVTDPAVAATAERALRILAVGIAAAGVAPLVSAYFQSLGRPVPSYLISVGSLVIIKVPLLLALGRTGSTGIWISLAAGEAASALAAFTVLRRLRFREGAPERATPS